MIEASLAILCEDLKFQLPSAQDYSFDWDYFIETAKRAQSVAEGTNNAEA